MKKNKNKKLLIIIIVLVALILIVGTVFAFVATDIFKSDKDLFFKYASQILDNEKGLLDNKLEQYYQKKSNSTYEFLGNFSANVDSDTLSKTALTDIDNLNISFAGNVDNIFNQAEALVKVNYSDNVNFPILFKKSDGILGIKMNDVAKKYLAVKENELSSFLRRFDVNLPISLNSIDFSKFNISNTNNAINEKYLQIIKDNLEDSSFSKVKGMNSEGYCLEISNQKILNIIVKVLENLKDDEQTLDKINDFLGTIYNSEDIDILVQYLSKIELNEAKSRITIYQKDGKLCKIDIQFNDQINFSITKNSTDNDVNYNFYAETQNYSISFDAMYSGLNTLQSIEENYKLSLVIGDSYTYNIENTVNFTDEIEIKEFETNEYSDLNKMSKDQLNKLFDALVNSIDKVNKEKLEKAEIVGQNPLQNIIPDFNKLFLNTANTTKNETITKTTETNTTNISDTTDLLDTNNNKTENTNTEKETNTDNNTNNNTNNSNSSSSNIVEKMEEVEKESFNARFTQYEGQNVRGATVKSLIMQIIATNMADEENLIEVTGDITLTGDEVPDTVDTNKTYRVKCSIGLDGYVESVEILENY